MKHILFDFDGTLVNSKNLAIDVINQLSTKYKFQKLKTEQIEELRKYSIRKRLSLLKFPIYKVPFAMADFIQLYHNKIGEVELFEGMKDVIEQLSKEGFRLSVISSNSEKTIRDFLKQNQIKSFSEIYSSSLFGKDKTMRRFMMKHSLKPTDILYVGDELRDIEACNQVGIPIAWVSWGFDAQEVTKLSRPTFIAKKPIELISIARNL